MSPTDLRRLVRALHRILRDGEGNSSLVERFDELTKVLYCKAVAERNGSGRTRDFRQEFQRLVKERPGLFPERFARLRLVDATLERLVETLGPATLTAADGDLRGLAYEEVIRNTFDKGDHQQFFTPRPLVEFIVQMVDWTGVRVVCDPAGGTGGFLLYVDQFLRRRGRKRPVRLLGFEIDERLAWAAGINLDLHGVRAFEIIPVRGAGSLGKEVRSYFGEIDAIVTNPPFGSDLSEPEALAALQLGRGRASRRRGVLFIERCLDLLRPGGLLAIIIDDSVLNTPANLDARRLILERSEPVAVVSLPETAFMPYATVKSSVLFLRKKRRRSTTVPTFFAQAEVVGRKPNGDPLLRHNPATGRPELDSDLPAILRAWQAGPKQSAVCCSRVFWTFMPAEDDTGFVDDGCRLDWAYHHPSRREAAEALRRSPYPLRTLAELCELRRETVIPARRLEDDELTYVGLANLEAGTGRCFPAIASAASLKSAVRRFVAGDVLFAKLRPELRKVCLVPKEVAEGYASAECLVLVPRNQSDGMLPELLAILLRTDLVYGQLVHLVTGIGRPRLQAAAVLGVRLPVPPVPVQRRLLKAYRRAEQASLALGNRSEQAALRARQLLDEARMLLARDLLGPR